MVKKSPPQNHSKQTIDASPSDDETQGIRIVDRAGRPALTLNVDDYRHYVEDMDLSCEQEEELLQTLWTIIVQFVDLGFGIEPVQQAMDARERAPQRKENLEKGLQHEFSE